MLKQKFVGVPWTTKLTFYGIAATLVLYVLVALLAGAFVRIPSVAPPVSGDSMLAIRMGIYSLIAEGTFLAAPFYFAWRATRHSGGDQRTLWQLLGLRGFNIPLAVSLILVSFVIIILVNEAYQWLIIAFHLPLQVNSDLVLKQGKIVPITTYVTLAMAVLWAPFCEELFFRSFSFMGFKNDMSLFVAVIFSALVFAAAHFDPASFPVLFVIGCALAIIRWKTNSVWPGMILHLMNNGLSAALVILSLHGINF